MKGIDRARTMEHARRYLSLLIQRGNDVEAVKLFKDCKQADAEFRPQDPAQILPLAKSARMLREPKAAIAMLNGFDKLNPGHPDTAAVYLLSARLLAEDLGRDDMARKVLLHVLSKYPGHSLAPEAAKLLEAVDAMSTAAPRPAA